jgi:hypothetical protein
MKKESKRATRVSNQLSSIKPLSDSKRSQVNIISLVLIILLVLVLIVIIWNVVSLLIKRSSAQVQVDQFVAKGDIKYYTAPLTPNSINVSLTRGTGEANIAAVKLLFEFTDGVRSYTNNTDIPKELETKVYLVDGSYLSPSLTTDFSGLKKISLFYIFLVDEKNISSREMSYVAGPSAGSSGIGGTPTPCTNGATQACTQTSPTFGTCTASGTQTCTSNTWGTCSGATDPRIANCVGKICGDDGCGGTCAPGCSGATPTCSGGTSCVAAGANCRNPADNPMHICTLVDLDKVRLVLTANYILDFDIDASITATTLNFDPIAGNSVANNGLTSVFTGNFNGNGHTISNLHIKKRSTNDYVGLFGAIDTTSKIYNLKIINSNISGNGYVGGLVGSVQQGNITNCSFSGNVSGSSNFIGGLVGEIRNSYYSNISGSYSTGNVVGTTSSTYVGGLVGYSGYYNTINNSYSRANVTGCSSDSGGLIGFGIYTTVANSYATGNVSCTGSQIGGLIGQTNWGSIYNSFSTGRVRSPGSNLGDLIGYNYGSTLTNCYVYFKIGDPTYCYTGGDQTSGCTKDNYEDDFFNPANPPMTNWAFDKIWKDNSGSLAYPTLKWQG